MSQKLDTSPAIIGIDIGKNSFHVVGHDRRSAIVLRQNWSRGQVEARLANMPPCLIGMEDLRRRTSSQPQAGIEPTRCASWARRSVSPMRSRRESSR